MSKAWHDEDAKYDFRKENPPKPVPAATRIEEEDNYDALMEDRDTEFTRRVNFPPHCARCKVRLWNDKDSHCGICQYLLSQESKGN